MSQSVLHMFSSMSFIVSGLTLRSLIHFDFILVYGVRECSNSIFYMQLTSFPAPLTEEALFSPLYILVSFIKNKLTICAWVCLWVFYPVPLICISVSVPVPQCLDYCSFAVQSEVSEPDSSTPFFFLSIALAIRGLLCFHTNCEMFRSCSRLLQHSGLLVIPYEFKDPFSHFCKIGF